MELPEQIIKQIIKQIIILLGTVFYRNHMVPDCQGSAVWLIIESPLAYTV